LDVFKAELLGSESFQAWYDYVKEALKEDGISPEEKAESDRLQKIAIDESEERWDAMTSGLDLPGSDQAQPGSDQPQTGLSGAIRASLTEDTGSLLAGIWRRHLDETINHTSIMDESNSYLSTISENTLRTAVACEALAGNTNQDGRDLGV